MDREERKQEKRRGTGELLFTQRLQASGKETYYVDTYEEGNAIGSVFVPQGELSHVADPEDPRKCLRLGYHLRVRDRRVARFLIKRCGPKGALGELTGKERLKHKGLMVDVRQAVESGFVDSEEECRGIMAGRIPVEKPLAPIPVFEMLSDDQLVEWALDNGIQGYDSRKPRTERLAQLRVAARDAFAKVKAQP